MLYRVISLTPSRKGYIRKIIQSDLILSDAQDLVDQRVTAGLDDMLVIEEQ